MGKLINEIGNKYSRLTVVGRAANQDTTAVWHCFCDCGNKTEVTGKKLRMGLVKSCGCYRKEKTTEQGHKNKLSIEHVSNVLIKNGYELLSDYIRSNKKATMKCITCNLIFTRKISTSLYNANGCPSCSKSLNGFIGAEFFKKNPHMKSKPCKLYLIEFEGNNEHFWKIGLTRQNINSRLSKIPYASKVVQTFEKTLEEVYEIERQIKKQYKPFRYFPKLNFNGKSECFKIPPELNKYSLAR